jgi:hypothetical protein
MLITLHVFYVGGSLKKLSEAEWFKDLYRKIYDITSIDKRLPEPQEIFVASGKEIDAPQHTLGLAFEVVVDGVKRKCIWFEEEPPEPVIFAHELLHLCRKSGVVEEEVYSGNLSKLIVLLAELSVTPKKNPLSLYEDVTLSSLMEALREAYGYNFRDLCEYYELIGVIPPFMVEKDSFGSFKIDPRYKEREIVFYTITDLIDGALHDTLALIALVKLLS